MDLEIILIDLENILIYPETILMDLENTWKHLKNTSFLTRISLFPGLLSKYMTLTAMVSSPGRIFLRWSNWYWSSFPRLFFFIPSSGAADDGGQESERWAAADDCQQVIDNGIKMIFVAIQLLLILLQAKHCIAMPTSLILVSRTFQYADKDSDGRISFEDFESIIGKLGGLVHKKMVVQVWREGAGGWYIWRAHWVGS